MIIKGTPVDSQILTVQKSIAANLQNQDLFQSENVDTAKNGTELKPPISMRDCLYVFKNSAHVAKSCRILSSDIIYNDITLTPKIDEPDEHLINQVSKINDFINDNIDELYNMAVDYNYAGWAAMEYTWNNVRFKLRQMPIHTCKIVRINLQGDSVYLLKQEINSKTKFFKIMGEDYPEDFQFYNNQKLGYVSLMGGDNIYQFFSLPKWLQDYMEILTEIAISAADYRTVSNGNISSGVLNINLEPQQINPIGYDDDGNPVINQKSREEIISNEIQSAAGGTAVIFTESNRPTNMDYVSLTNNNQQYLSDLSTKCEQKVLNDYNIPLVRLMINTEKESMNSNKTQSIWEIYGLNLKNEQKPFKKFISELIEELYSIDVDVDITTPIFSDRREIEVKLLLEVWEAGALTLKQLIIALSEFIEVININDYDFTANPEIWDYRKLEGLSETMSEEDIKLIEEVESQLKGFG